MRRVVLEVSELSTTSNETVTWQSNSSDLSRSEVALISSHWGEVTAHLVPPEVAWQWGECQVSHKVKCNWKHSGLIQRAPDGRRWMTTEALWLHVIDRAGDDETIGGEATGQQLLSDAPTGTSRATWYLGDPSARPRRASQATLTGDTADRQVVRSQHEPDWAQVNARKGMHGEEGRADAARHPSQSRLSTFEDYDLDAWDVTVPWFRGDAVRVPAGQMY